MPDLKNCFFIAFKRPYKDALLKSGHFLPNLWTSIAESDHLMEENPDFPAGSRELGISFL
jgi:hypothetical protein